METSIFAQLSIVIAIVAVVSLIMKQLKQPLIIGYIVTGVIVGPSVLNLVHAREAFESFSTIGITLLLFIVGLGLNPSVIKSLGKVALITSLSVMLPLMTLGFGLSYYGGFTPLASAVIAVAMSFSSTIIILKTLSDKKEVSRLHGQIAIGILLVEDVIATIALVGISVVSHGFSGSELGFLLLKLLGIGLVMYLVSVHVMPRLSKLFASSQELLFLFALAWGMLVATLFQMAGFSYEIGALFAGVSLAGLPYAAAMAARLKPLRDFFVVIFFVTLGEVFTFGSIAEHFLLAHCLALVVILGKPFLIMTSLGIQGYTKFTSFKTALHLSQISEFSIILVMFALTNGLVPNSAVQVITLVALISIGASSYLSAYDNKLYKKLEPHLRFFERHNLVERPTRRESYPVIMFGYHKGGSEFVKTFREMRLRYLVVDYDPEVIEELESQGIRHAYGDATDHEFLDEINLGTARLVVSTVSDVAVNRIILSYINHHDGQPNFICHADNYEQATRLYNHGASYVSLPHLIGSEKVNAFIRRHGIDGAAMDGYRKQHILEIGRQALKD